MGSPSDTDTTSNNSLSFIPNSPIGEDQFEGKAQERIAKSIARLIKKKNKRKKNKIKNKLIGLDGAWGSGKSNLIEILKKKLSKEYHFFIYDAWGHQEDLQRRSFLEELTEDLCDKKIIDSATWDEKLEDLLSRKIETKTKTIYKIGYSSFIAILALLIKISPTIPATINEWKLETLIPSVLILLIGALAYFIPSWNKTFVTISEKEPSVKEFQKWMTDLSDALTTKKLVVVFDNMDRLPPDKVWELWSLIHTFFAEDVFESIWIIVPFDRNHIAAAFEGKSAASKNKDKISEDFLNKSFSVIYRVAPPVLTDWKQFFDLKFKKAFGESEQQEELDCVKKIFGRLQKKITPRNIIAFINEIVSLHQIAKEEKIKLRYMAVFVLAKKEILSDPVNMILDRNYLNNVEDIFAGDDDLPDHIASLVYQVPLKLASQVMLTREIQNALNDRNISRLTKLASHPNFRDILKHVVDKGDLNISNAVITLAELERQD